MKFITSSRCLTMVLVMALLGIAVAVKHHMQSQVPAAVSAIPESDPRGLARLERLEAELASLSASPESGASDASETRIAALRLEMVELRKMLERLGVTPGQPANERSSIESNEPVDEPGAERERTQRLVAFLDNAFAGAGSDPGWSAAATRAISGTVADSESQRTQLVDVHCQATLCRIEASHATRDAEQNFVMNLTQLDEFRDAEAFLERVEQGDGNVATTIFVSRAGYRLPSPG